MATDREVAEWHREWRELFADMGRRELVCVLRELGTQLGIRDWISNQDASVWARLEDRIMERAQVDALTDNDLDDIPF